MQLQRLNGIPEIAGKYAIEYSKNDLNNERRNLMNLLHRVNINVSDEDAQTFTDWAEPNIKTKNIQKSRRKSKKILQNNQGSER